MEASSKASFKFIFIQHFKLIEQTRTRDCTKKKATQQTTHLSLWRNTLKHSQRLHWARHCGLGTENKLVGIPNEQGGAGESTVGLGGLLQISHCSTQNTFPKVWKPLLCCVSPKPPFLTLVLQKAFLLQQGKPGSGAVSTLPDVREVPAPSELSQSAHRGSEQSMEQLQVFPTPLSALHSRQIVAIKHNFQRFAVFAGRNLRGKNGRNYHLKILCQDQSSPFIWASPSRTQEYW